MRGALCGVTWPHIGSIIEFPGFYPNLSGHDNLKAFQLLYGGYDKASIDRVLDTVGLSEAACKKAGTYSLGMKQRLGLARALLHDPDILILDEPTNGLDPAGILDMCRMLRSVCADHGKTIFLSSHILAEVEQIVDVVGIIKDGRTIEETGIEALREKCLRGLRIAVSDPDRAAALLREHMHVTCTVDPNDNTLNIAHKADAASVNSFLVGQGHRVSMLTVSAQSLEEYFLAATA